MTKPKRRLRITDRDRVLFDYLISNKVATVEQIQRDVLRTHKRYVYIRLGQLARAGMIRRQATYQNRAISYYSIGKMATRDQPFERRDLGSVKFKSDSPIHDMVLVDIRHSLVGYEQVDQYITENDIQLQIADPGFPVKELASIRSDAAFRLRRNGKMHHIAVEFENHHQNRGRYEHKFHQYHHEMKVSLVLYIVSSERIKNKMIQIDKDICPLAQSRLFFCTLEKVLSRPTTLVFENFRSAAFVLKRPVVKTITAPISPNMYSDRTMWKRANSKSLELRCLNQII